MGIKKSKMVSNYDSQHDFETTPDIERKSNYLEELTNSNHAISEKEESNKPQSKHSNHSNVSGASRVPSKERSLLAFSDKSSQSLGKENEPNQQSFLDFSSPAFKKMYSIRADKNVQELYRESIEQKSYVRQQILRPGEEEANDSNGVTDESGLHLHLHFHLTDNERKDLFLHVHHHDGNDDECGSDCSAEGSDEDDYYYNYYDTNYVKTERSKSKISVHDQEDPSLKVHLCNNNNNNNNNNADNTTTEYKNNTESNMLQKTKTIMSLASRQFTSSSLLMVDDTKEGLPKLILPNDVNPDRDFKRVPTKLSIRRRSSILSRKNSQSIDNDLALPKLVLANDIHPDRDFKRIPTKPNLKRKKSLNHQNSVSNDIEQAIPHLVIPDEIDPDRDFKNSPIDSVKLNKWSNAPKIPTIDEGLPELKETPEADDINCVEPFEDNGKSSTNENEVSSKIINSIDTKLSKLREEDPSENIEGNSKAIHIDKNYNENLHLHVHVHKPGEE